MLSERKMFLQNIKLLSFLLTKLKKGYIIEIEKGKTSNGYAKELILR